MRDRTFAREGRLQLRPCLRSFLALPRRTIGKVHVRNFDSRGLPRRSETRTRIREPMSDINARRKRPGIGYRDDVSTLAYFKANLVRAYACVVPKRHIDRMSLSLVALLICDSVDRCGYGRAIRLGDASENTDQNACDRKARDNGPSRDISFL